MASINDCISSYTIKASLLDTDVQFVEQTKGSNMRVKITRNNITFEAEVGLLPRDEYRAGSRSGIGGPYLIYRSLEKEGPVGTVHVLDAPGIDWGPFPVISRMNGGERAEHLRMVEEEALDELHKMFNELPVE